MSHLAQLELGSRAIRPVAASDRRIDLLCDGACTMSAARLNEKVKKESAKNGNRINARMPREPLVLNGQEQMHEVRGQLHLGGKLSRCCCEWRLSQGIREHACDAKKGSAETPHGR